MKNYLTTNKYCLLFIAIVSVGIVASFLTDFREGKLIFNKNILQYSKYILLFLPFLFILIGLANVWISKEKVEKLIGSNSGIKGYFVIFLLSNLQGGTLYGAIPVAYLLWEKGASIRNIFIYLGMFCTLKIPMLMFEIGFLGWKFSLIRTLVTIPFIIGIAIVMEKYLQTKSTWIKNPFEK
jgi:uncharacterized membrane protein YraQ (UPF0718 family)